jgi:methionyl-tRNA synthetase
VQLGGERFSKSAGVKLDLGEAIDRYGADAFRYVLLRELARTCAYLLKIASYKKAAPPTKAQK